MGLLLLTACVLIAHLALLGLLPPVSSPKPLPAPRHFKMRAIKIASLTSPAPPSPPHRAAAPVPMRPATPGPHHRRTPPPPEPQRPQPISPQAALPYDDALPAAPTSPSSSPPSSSSEAAAAPSSNNVTGASGGVTSGRAATDATGLNAVQAGTGDAPSTVEPKHIHSTVHLHFDMTGQRGAQPLAGAYGEIRWSQNGDRYNAEMALRFLFKTFIRWTSVGRIGASGIEPTRFVQARGSKIEIAEFAADAGQVSFSNNHPAVTLLAGAQDRLSILMQLGALIAADPARYRSGGRISIQTVGPSDADVWIFEIGGAQTVQTLAGTFETLRLIRVPRFESDARLTLWLAPKLGYLPVQMRQDQSDGLSFELHLRSAS
jgi:hypothetical protein